MFQDCDPRCCICRWLSQACWDAVVVFVFSKLPVAQSSQEVPMLRTEQRSQFFWKAGSGCSVVVVFLTAVWCSSQETAHCSLAASPSTMTGRCGPARRWRPRRRNSAHRLLRRWSCRAPSPGSPSAGHQRNWSQTSKIPKKSCGYKDAGWKPQMFDVPANRELHRSQPPGGRAVNMNRPCFHLVIN